MIELPEALNLAKQLREYVCGKTVAAVYLPTKPHRFCFWNGDASSYPKKLTGRTISGSSGFGIFVDIDFSGGISLAINDGVNVRLMTATDAPQDYQFMLVCTDGTAVVFTVAMYGGIFLHDDTFDNEYYLSSKAAVSPFSADFAPYFRQQLSECKPNISAKAFLATAQRFPGIGNGVLQDILLQAGIHPKRKLQTLGEKERELLLTSVTTVLRCMTDNGGRDTEKTLLGTPGGYRTRLSKNTLASGCPVCGGTVQKETYLGGSVYFCPHCQPLIQP